MQKARVRLPDAGFFFIGTFFRKNTCSTSGSCSFLQADAERFHFFYYKYALLRLDILPLSGLLLRHRHHLRKEVIMSSDSPSQYRFTRNTLS